MELRDWVAIVIVSGRRVSRAIALAMAEQRADVMVVARTTCSPEEPSLSAAAC